MTTPRSRSSAATSSIKNIAAEVAYAMLIDKDNVEVNAPWNSSPLAIFPPPPNLSLLGKFGFANIDVKTPGV